MENVGALAILLAFCLAIYAAVGSVAGKIFKKPFLGASGERAVYAVWLLLTLASGILVYSLFTGDFRMAYVAEHSNQGMKGMYKFTAWWGGQEGSLLLWSWLLSTYSVVVVFTNRRKLRNMMPYVTGILMVTESFFLMLVTFVVKNLTDDFMIRPTSKEFWALNAFLIGYGVRKLRERPLRGELRNLRPNS